MSEQLHPVPAEEWVQNTEETPMQEGEIISGLRRGDQTAWTTLYDTYSVRIWRYVAKLVGPNADAVGDIVQESVLAAAQSAQSFNDSKGTLWQWLTGIAHNSVSKYWRVEQQANRLQRLLEANAGDGPPLGAVDPPKEWVTMLLARSEQLPGENMERQELADIVRAAMAQLPADYADLLTAKYVDELSLAEIQRQTGSSSDAVRSKLVRARSEFRDVFQRMTND